ncbi:hypothetical protein EPUS_02378 [Endocarpon pusillum Z07020]|uniref:Conidiation-specific protein 6 n=1 Tax=Endocarpon pusillum (strain Z07020 / HMAS-L-300199) TaxID=1263415 RepID=U1GGF3_ENDPU|nr:uncharacterized protein EPUS_02378 [Endocarpon pusillum Z07020]ERF70856.1 hypothetical protein EPUS_02378 [Endocarpon pusillum Z07020]
MAIAAGRDTEDQYEARYDGTGSGVPSGEFRDDSYIEKTDPVPPTSGSKPLQRLIPIQNRIAKWVQSKTSQTKLADSNRKPLQENALSFKVIVDDSCMYSTLSNPKVSEEAKENARAQLDAMEGGPSIPDETGETKDKNPGNVAGGLKAAINNPQVSEEGKKAAQGKLDNM